MSDDSNNPETTPDTASESVTEPTEGQGVTEDTAPVDRAAYDALKAEFDAFKRAVVETTGRYAEAHDLCSVADQALAELGLRRVRTGHRVSVTLVASWEMGTTTRGRAGAPSESHVWGRVESLAAHLRYDGIDGAKNRLSRAGSDFSNLALTTAEVKVETLEPSPDAHLIPSLRARECMACGHMNPEWVSDCRECDEDMDDN